MFLFFFECFILNLQKHIQFFEYCNFFVCFLLNVLNKKWLYPIAIGATDPVCWITFGVHLWIYFTAISLEFFWSSCIILL